jgi:hypothetical protein
LALSQPLGEVVEVQTQAKLTRQEGVAALVVVDRSTLVPRAAVPVLQIKDITVGLEYLETPPVVVVELGRQDLQHQEGKESLHQ